MNISSLIRFYKLSLFSLLLITMLEPVFASESPLIVITGAQASAPYQQTLESFKTSIKQARPGVKIIHHEFGEDIKPLPSADVVFALGSSATSQSLQELGDSELVATMILNDKLLQNHKHATAVLLSTSVKKQLEWHRRILPNARRIGVLYDPQFNQEWIDTAKQAAKKQKLEIIAVPVSHAKELPAALKLLGRQADSILGIADQTVYSSKTAKAVLLFSFRNRIPFVGLSSAWVKSGALYALDWDYAELGQQCASIVMNILDGKKTHTIKPQQPEKQLYLLNLKTARQMKLSLSQTLIDGAARVYE